MIQVMAQFVLLIIRPLLAAVLVAAGAAKLTDVRGFATTLVGLGVPSRPRYLVRGISLVVPAFEMGTGLAIVSGLWPELANGVLLLVMSFFNFVTIRAILRNPHLTCRCFGALSDSQFSYSSLIRGLVLTFLAVIVVWSGTVEPAQFDEAPFAIILLAAGYLVFAGGVAQAAKTIAVLKEMTGS